MKKFFSILLLVGSCSSLPRTTLAQTSTVNATVVDSDGTTWANGSWTLTFVPATSTAVGSYNYNGTPLDPTILSQKGLLNSSGVLAITLYNNTAISPAGSSWSLTLCPNASATCTNYLFSVASSSVNISANLTALIHAPRFKAISGAFGYNDTEAIITLAAGNTYWNVTGNVQRYYTGSTWIDGNGSGILAYPPAGVSISTGTAWAASLTAPTGALVGTTDTQVLTNKTIDGVSPTALGFVDATSSIQGQLNAKPGFPASGMATSNGSAWTGSRTAPAGTIVGTTDTQVLTNKTVDGVSPAVFAYLDPSSSVQTQFNTVQTQLGTKQDTLPTNIQITTGVTPIGAGVCTANTAALFTGVLTTSAIIPPTPTSSTNAVTGWGASGGLSFTYYVTLNTFNWSVCNSTGASITPGSSLTWNVGVRP